MKNNTTIEMLLNESAEQDQHKADYIIHPTEIKFSNDDNMNFSMSQHLFGENAKVQVSAKPTDWAWRQLFSKLGASVFKKGENKTLPNDYMLALRPDLRAYILNDHLKNYPNGNWMIRNYDQDCRAVLSDRYAAIPNTELLDLLYKASDNTKAENYLASSSVTPDSLNVRQIWKDVNRPGSQGGWGIGIAITNGETGQRKLRGKALIQRHQCQNSIIVDMDMGGFEFTHHGSVQTKMIVVKSVMQEILPFAAEMLEKMIESQSHDIPDFTDVLQGLAIHYGWEEKIAAEVAIGTEGQHNLFGLVNGVTHAAKFAKTDDDRMSMETLGGGLLITKDSVFYRMANLTKEQK